MSKDSALRVQIVDYFLGWLAVITLLFRTGLAQSLVLTVKLRYGRHLTTGGLYDGEAGSWCESSVV